MIEKHSARTEAGFTLLEMIVSVTLVAMMAVGLWGVFRVSVNSWARGTQAVDTNQRYRTVWDLVHKQMASIYALTTPMDPQTGSAPFPIFKGFENSVVFVSLNSLSFQESPGLTLVAYELAQNRSTGYALVEREERYLGLDASLDSISDRKDIRTNTIFDNLTSFSFEYFFPGSNDKPAAWFKEWDGKELKSIPAAISMTMITRDSAGNNLSRHMVVPIRATPNDPRLNFLNPFQQNIAPPVAVGAP